MARYRTVRVDSRSAFDGNLVHAACCGTFRGDRVLLRLGRPLA